jgi:hypothetical protein
VIETCSCVVFHHGQGVQYVEDEVICKLFLENDVNCGPAWPRPCLCFAEDAMLWFAMPNEPARYEEFNQEVEICLYEVDDAESMEFWHVCFLFEHSSDDYLPVDKGDSMFGA